VSASKPDANSMAARTDTFALSIEKHSLASGVPRAKYTSSHTLLASLSSICTIHAQMNPTENGWT